MICTCSFSVTRALSRGLWQFCGDWRNLFFVLSRPLFCFALLCGWRVRDARFLQVLTSMGEKMDENAVNEVMHAHSTGATDQFGGLQYSIFSSLAASSVDSAI